MHDVRALLGLQGVVFAHFDQALDDEVECIDVVVVKYQVPDAYFFGLVIYDLLKGEIAVVMEVDHGILLSDA